MYEIKCPQCQSKQSSAFVRVGAIAACPSCSNRFRIEDKNLRRSVDQNVGQSLQPEEELRARVGLSGLSEVMRRESPPVAASSVTASQHAVKRPSGGPASHIPGAKTAKINKASGQTSNGTAHTQPPQRPHGLLLSLAAFGGLAFVLIVVWLLILLFNEFK